MIKAKGLFLMDMLELGSEVYDYIIPHNFLRFLVQIVTNMF